MSFNSYAQNFEDVMLWRALGHVQDGFYIDIGAQHPLVDSVSLAFHEHGWHGIHVEPLPQYSELLRAQRPGDTVLQAAVAASAEVLQFYEIPDSGISTADPEIAASHRARGFETREIAVPSVTLASVFGMCRGRDIHWLKIDVEGFEAKVLASWGKSRARPWIVVVESTLPLSQVETHQQWEGSLLRLGYTPAYFDGLNRYYIAAAHPELKDAFGSPPNVFDGFTLNGTASAPFQKLLEQRHQDQLAVNRAEADSRVQTAEAVAQAQLAHIAEIEEGHRDAIWQRDHAHSERVQQVEQRQLELLGQMEQEHAARIHEAAQREAQLAEQARLLDAEVENLLRQQSEREREAMRVLLESQQDAAREREHLTREWTEMTRIQLAQAEERQRQHLDREALLLRQLHAAQEDRRLGVAETNRLQALVEAVNRETTDRVEAIYQRAGLEREQAAHGFEQRLLQLQRDHAEERSAAELQSSRLAARSEEHKSRAEQLAQELGIAGAKLVAEQQSVQRLQAELAAARREIEETQRTVSWRLTRPLRYLASALPAGK